MASYDAVVNLNVVGTSRLERVNAAVGQLNNLTRQLNNNLNLLAPGADNLAGKYRELGDKLRQAFEPIKNFAREASNGTAKLANTLAGAAAQAQVFATVLDNVKIKAGGLGAQEATVKNLSAAWLETTLNAQRYQKVQEELKASQLAAKGLMQLGSGEIVRGTEAGFGEQGPKLPSVLGTKRTRGGMDLPAGVSRLAPKRLQGLQAAFAKPGMADAIIGGGFPLLFGGGPGAVLGGFGGGFAGGMLGGPLGMVLSIGASAIGQQLDKAFGESIRLVNELGKATQTLNLDALRDSVIAVNADLDISVERLIKAGQADAARAKIATQVTLQTGLLPEETAATEQAVSALNTAWNEVVGAVSGLLSIIGRPFVTALAVIAQGIAKAVQGVNLLLQLLIKYHPVLALINKLWTEIGNRLPKVNEDQEQLRAEIERQTDAYSKQIDRSMKLEQIDKRRNNGNTAAARIQNNELDRQVKIEELRGKTEDKIAEARLKFKGQDIKLLEAQIRAEAAIEERAINREAARRRERLELERALDVLQATLKAEESRIAIQSAYREQNMRVVQSELDLNKELVNIEVSRLESQQKYAMSLNQTSAVIDKIATDRVKSAQIEADTAQAQADNSVLAAAAEKKRATAAAFNAKQQLLLLGRQGDLTEAKKEDLQAIIDQEAVASRNLTTTIATADNTRVAAAARLEHNKYTIELARREKQLAAYVAEVALESERARQAAAEHLSKVENSTRRVTSFADAYITINNVQKSMLEAALEDVRTADQKKNIIHQIYKIEIANAKLALASTKAQIAADIERQRLLLRNAELKYEELRSTLLLAEAQGNVTREHYAALDAQASSLRIAKDTYQTTKQIAAYQLTAAEAVYRGAVFTADRARKERLSEISPSNVSSFAEGGYVTGPTRAVVGEGGESEYIIPASKMDEAMSRYASGQRGSSVIPSSINPQVNVTTGPVMNMNGSNYVSQQDFMAGMQTASRRGAEMALEALQGNSGIRRSVGIV